MRKDDFGDRMKDYERAGERYLTKRTPVILRLDGCHFHSFTKGFRKPFDYIFLQSMRETTQYLCENIQGAVLGYTQSDEITIVLIDYKHLNTSAWFDNRQNKIESVAASMCTMAFNKFFAKNAMDCIQKCEVLKSSPWKDHYAQRLCEAYKTAIEKGAIFDCRAFNIPKEEVTNNFYWRQSDAIRNSVRSVGYANYSSKALMNKNCYETKEMLKEKNVDWDEFPVCLQRGTGVFKEVDANGRSHWKIDLNIPVFKGEGREYIEKLLEPEEERHEKEKKN